MNWLLEEPRTTDDFSYTLPTETDVQRKNLVYLLLDLELRYGRNGAIPFAREPTTRELCLSRFEEVATSFGKMVGLSWMRRHQDYFQEIDEATAGNILYTLHAAMREAGLHPPPPSEGDNVDFLTPGLLHGSVDCDIYSFVVLGVAERYEIPLAGVQSPRHFFTRWESRQVRLNYDQGNISESDDQYVDGSYTNPLERHISLESLAQETYLRRLTKLETVADHLGTIASGLIKNNELETALELTTLATRWAPRIAIVHYERARALQGLHRLGEAMNEYRIVAALDPGFPSLLFRAGW